MEYNSCTRLTCCSGAHSIRNLASICKQQPMKPTTFIHAFVHSRLRSYPRRRGIVRPQHFAALATIQGPQERPLETVMGMPSLVRAQCSMTLPDLHNDGGCSTALQANSLQAKPWDQSIDMATIPLCPHHSAISNTRSLRHAWQGLPVFFIVLIELMRKRLRPMN